MIEINLSRGYSAIIDDEDAHLAQDRWYAMTIKGGLIYAVRKTKISDGAPRKTLLLHRLILGASKGDIVDHMDGDGLNNRRANLRFVSHTENMRNRTPSKRGLVVGVRPSRNGKRWLAFITKDLVNTYLGTFDTYAEAVAARLAAERALWGKIPPRREGVHATGPS